METKDLINWGELSRMLSGSRQTVRKNKIPKSKTFTHTTIKWTPDYDNLCEKSKNEPYLNWYAENSDTVEHIITLMAHQTATFIASINYRYNKGVRIEHTKKANV